MGISRSMRNSIYHECNGQCHYCGTGLQQGGWNTTVDHMTPKSYYNNQRHANNRSNLTLACLSCNREKGDMDYNQFVYGGNRRRRRRRRR